MQLLRKSPAGFQLTTSCVNSSTLYPTEKEREQTGSRANKSEQGVLREAVRTNPTCPTNTSVYHADGRAIKQGGRSSKAEVNRFPGSQPRQAACSCVSVSCEPTLAHFLPGLWGADLSRFGLRISSC